MTPKIETCVPINKSTAVKKSVGWTVAVCLLGMLGSLIAANLHYIKTDVREVRTEINRLALSLSAIKGNRFTSSDGKEVWKRIADLESKYALLPPEQWRIMINQNTLRIAEINAVLGVNSKYRP